MGAGAQTPRDNIARAQAALNNGSPEPAVAFRCGLAFAHPDDVDLLRRQAAAYAANGDLETAQCLIDQALFLAPNDLDIRLAHANILLWRGKLGLAETEARAVAAVAPGYPGLAELNAAIARRRAETGPRLAGASFSQEHSRASFPQVAPQTWSRQEASLAVSLDPLTSIALSAEREERLTTDTRLSARLDKRVAGVRFYLAGSVTPEADFREEWSVSTGADYALSRGTGVLLDLRYAAYNTGDVATAQLGVRQSLGKDFSVTARAINLIGGGTDYRIGGAVRFDYAPDRRIGYFLGAASYPDTEVDGTRQMQTVAAGVVAPLGDHLTVRFSGEYERRSASYSRKVMTLGISWRFDERR